MHRMNPTKTPAQLSVKNPDGGEAVVLKKIRGLL